MRLAHTARITLDSIRPHLLNIIQIARKTVPDVKGSVFSLDSSAYIIENNFWPIIPNQIG